MKVKFLEDRQTLYGLVTAGEVVNCLEADGRQYVMSGVAVSVGNTKKEDEVADNG